MIAKTEAIVLRSRKFKETSLIVQLYTLDKGKCDFIVLGGRGKAALQHTRFQPGSIIEIIYYYKDNRQLQKITESSSVVIYQRLQQQPQRMLYLMLLVEIIELTVADQDPDNRLYALVRQTLLTLDMAEVPLFETFMLFLVTLCRVLGFGIEDISESSTTVWLNVEFARIEAASSEKAQPEVLLLRELLNQGTFSSNILPSSRKILIDLMIEYIFHHVATHLRPRSLAIFQQLFK